MEGSQRLAAGKPDALLLQEGVLNSSPLFWSIPINNNTNIIKHNSCNKTFATFADLKALMALISKWTTAGDKMIFTVFVTSASTVAAGPSKKP